jgi:hypothetical protein
MMVGEDVSWGRGEESKQQEVVRRVTSDVAGRVAARESGV